MKRDLVVWMYDVSKQGFGAMFIHVWNIVLSIQEVRVGNHCLSSVLSVCANRGLPASGLLFVDGGSSVAKYIAVREVVPGRARKVYESRSCRSTRGI